MFEKLLNRKIVEVRNLNDGMAFEIEFEDGIQRFEVYADCCSSSWIEHLDVPSNVKGSTLLSIDEQTISNDSHPEYDCLQVYETRFRTNKGDIVLEYRNSSNGYYGGSLVMVDKNGQTWR